MQQVEDSSDELALNAFHNEINNVSYEFIIQHTIQIFYSKNGYPNPTASAVLITLNDRYFLITAGHVFENEEWAYIAWLRNEGLPLDTSKIVRTKPPIEGDVNSDKYDIAMLEFDGQTARQIISDGVSFLPVQNMDFENKPNDLTTYRIIGFIAAQTKVVNYSAKCQTFNYTSIAQAKFNYGRFGFNAEHHIAVGYDGKATSKSAGTTFTVPVAHGLSGCGLWSICAKSIELPSDEGYIRAPVIIFGEPKKNIRLSGIVIEQIQKEMPNKAIIATQIHVVIGYLIQCFQITVS